MSTDAELKAMLERAEKAYSELMGVTVSHHQFDLSRSFRIVKTDLPIVVKELLKARELLRGRCRDCTGNVAICRERPVRAFLGEREESC